MKGLAALALLVPLAAAGQPGAGAGTDTARHAYVKRNGIDPKYVNARNPLEASASNVEAGRKLYRLHCSICHGDSGRGNAGGRSLRPPVTSLVGLSRRPIATDAYLDWTISEGGVAELSAMPPFKNVLKQDDIWKIVLFLRTL